MFFCNTSLYDCINFICQNFSPKIYHTALSQLIPLCSGHSWIFQICCWLILSLWIFYSTNVDIITYLKLLTYQDIRFTSSTVNLWLTACKVNRILVLPYLEALNYCVKNKYNYSQNKSISTEYVSIWFSLIILLSKFELTREE